MDVESYLRRRADELISDVRQEARLAVAARAWFEGAVRALEATGDLNRETGTTLLEGFDDRLQDEGFIEQVTISHSATTSTSVRAEQGPAVPIEDRRDPPEFEGVTSFGQEVQIPGDLRLLLLHVTRWSTGVDLSWALLGPSSALRETRIRTREVRRRLSPLPWELDVWDDVGTRYRVDGASAGGGAQRQRAEVRLAPRVPDEASSLTIVLRHPDTRDEVAQLAVTLDAG